MKFKTESPSCEEFKKANEEVVKSCFTRPDSSRKRNRVSTARTRILLQVIRARWIYAFVRLIFWSPNVVLAQLELRRGGLSGSYQWERL